MLCTALVVRLSAAGLAPSSAVDIELVAVQVSQRGRFARPAPGALKRSYISLFCRPNAFIMARPQCLHVAGLLACLHEEGRRVGTNARGVSPASMTILVVLLHEVRLALIL